jgi:hypothetical protein
MIIRCSAIPPEIYARERPGSVSRRTNRLRSTAAVCTRRGREPSGCTAGRRDVLLGGTGALLVKRYSST